jgi:hypothetical protein
MSRAGNESVFSAVRILCSSMMLGHGIVSADKKTRHASLAHKTYRHVVAVDRAYRHQDAWGEWTDNITHHWAHINGHRYLIWDWTV